MHNNYYFLKKLSAELQQELQHATLLESFSQKKDELLLVFDCKGSLFHLQAYLSSSFSCLSFPDTFVRAHKNVATLFEELYGLSIKAVVQFDNERAFCLHFENDYQLLFKMFGNKSNIILFQNFQVIKLFKNSLLQDKNINYQALDRPLLQNFDNFQKNELALFPTLDAKLLSLYQYPAAGTLAEKFAFLEQLVQLFQSNIYSVISWQGMPKLLMGLQNEPLNQFAKAKEALNYFFRLYISQENFIRQKSSMVGQLEKALFKYKEMAHATRQQLNTCQELGKYSRLADVIMANLHCIHEGQTEVELFNFYTNTHQLIKLKPSLSSQRYAEYLYQKSKNEYLEKEALERNLNKYLAEISKIETQLQHIQAAENFKEFSKISKNIAQLTKATEPGLSLPFRVEYVDNFTVLIGKNAQNNDLLTTQYAKKDDLWLHARDVAGSHVVVKYQSGRNFPKNVIERAAELAAYHSKRRNDSLCPVIVTAKKYVRKTKNLPAGKVIVDKEEVLMVQPRP